MIIISAINQTAFQELLGPDLNLDRGVGVEIDWFTDLDENIIGTVGEGKPTEGWSYAVLQRNPDGRFYVSTEHHHFPTRHTARMQLFRQLVEAGAAEPARLAA